MQIIKKQKAISYIDIVYRKTEKSSDFQAESCGFANLGGHDRYQVVSVGKSASSSPRAAAGLRDAQGMDGKLLEAAQKEAEKV